jgi:hypothetical protein
MNGYRYRCKISGLCLPEIFTDGTSTLVVTPAIGSEELETGKIGLLIYPNPVTADSKILIRAPAGSEVSLIIRNLIGKIRFSENTKVINDDALNIEFPVQLTGSGVYFLSGRVDVDGARYWINKKLIIPE